MTGEVRRYGNHPLFLTIPDPGSWSAAQCVDHLNSFSRQFLPVIEDRLAHDEQTIEDLQRIRAGLVAALVQRTVGPGGRWMKTRTFEPLVPGAELEPDSVVEAFSELQERWIALARLAANSATSRIRIRSMFVPLKMSAAGWMLFNLAHQRRHIGQAGEAIARAEAMTG